MIANESVYETHLRMLSKIDLKTQRQISDFFGVCCKSLSEVTVQNFRLLFPTENENKAF